MILVFSNHRHTTVIGYIIVLLFWAIVTGNGCVAKNETNERTINLVIVTAYNCESCSSIDESIDYLKQNNKTLVNKTLTIKKTDIHTPEGANYVSRYQLWRIPVYLFLDDKGSELYRIEGQATRDELLKAVERIKTR